MPRKISKKSTEEMILNVDAWLKVEDNKTTLFLTLPEDEEEYQFIPAGEKFSKDLWNNIVVNGQGPLY